MIYARITPLNRLVRPLFNRSYEPSQEARDAWERRGAERNARKAEFLKTWTPPFLAPTDSDADGHPDGYPDGYLEARHIEWAAFDCWELQQAGKVAAATAPHWVNHVEELWLNSMGNEGTGILEREPTAASITLPFLMQGGEFSVTYESEKEQTDFSGPITIRTSIRSTKRLRVQSEHGIHYGEMKCDYGEMRFELVILPGGTPQDATDRVASVYSKIVILDMPADYPAIMPLRESCAFCGRPFTDQVSKVIGIGPVCCKQMGLPHGPETANRILQRRRELLGDLAL